MKGAPDILIKKCKTYMKDDDTFDILDNQISEGINKIIEGWCEQSRRVILLAKKEFTSEDQEKFKDFDTDQIEDYLKECNDFCYVGIIGLVDPPREGIAEVLKQVRRAGIRVCMVTGDFKITALAIAKEIGLFTRKKYDDYENLIGKKKKKMLISLLEKKLKKLPFF